MTYSIPPMDDIRMRIRVALEKPNVDGKGLARELGISPAQVSSMLKDGGRRIDLEEITIIEGYLGIRLLDVHPDTAIADGAEIKLRWHCTAVRSGDWVRVHDEDGDEIFTMKAGVTTECLNEVALIRRQALHRGQKVGVDAAWRALRNLIGAKAEDE